MKPIGPDHPITVTAHPRQVRVLFQDHMIADTRRALLVQEASYKPVFYFPREDVSMDYLARTALTTHCPYKGDASYYSINRDGVFAENAVWTYETPFDQMAPIREYLAFYPNKVDVHEIDDQGRRLGDGEEIRDAILHTDSGSGASQKEHWAPNVSAPGT